MVRFINETLSFFHSLSPSTDVCVRWNCPPRRRARSVESAPRSSTMMRPADMRTENERGGIKKLMAKTTFPANFKEKVDMSKVNMETMAPWIQSEVEKYVGFDDEVLVGYVQSQLVPPDGSPVDPRAVQINLMGFLEKHTSTFMKELCALALAPTLLGRDGLTPRRPPSRERAHHGRPPVPEA